MPSMAAATGLPTVSSARSARLMREVAGRAASRAGPSAWPPAVSPSSPRSAPAQKPFALPEARIAPLIATSSRIVATMASMSATALSVKVFIVRPGTSNRKVATPSASTETVKLFMSLS
ncbi:hypothetical protein D3C80_1770350 [compost metagenome]